MRLLILGGTSEASGLARAIAGRRDLEPLLSFAGRTRRPADPPIPFRTGGFGGVEGLKNFLIERDIAAVVDATHPFAARMSSNAAEACRDLARPLAVYGRPAWQAVKGDRWTRVADEDAAVRALGETPRRVFLTIGGVRLAHFAAAPWHHYIVRTIEPPGAIASLPSHQLVLARGPFSLEGERELMRAAAVQVLVTKNSGGGATAAKLAAARVLGVEVIMIERPPASDVAGFDSLDTVLAWIEAHRPAP